MVAKLKAMVNTGIENLAPAVNLGIKQGSMLLVLGGLAALAKLVF